MVDFKVLCNGEEAYLPRKLLNKFQVLNRTIMEISQSAENIDSVIIDQPMEIDCSPEIFSLLIDWLRHHVDDDTYWNGVKLDDDPMLGSEVEPLTGWDKAFLEKLEPITYYTFVIAAIDLEVIGLTTMICRDMATRIMVPSDILPQSLQIEECIHLLTNSEA